MRTFIYVDGFNLYYGELKGTPWRWLDLPSLFSKGLPPNHSILTGKTHIFGRFATIGRKSRCTSGIF